MAKKKTSPDEVSAPPAATRRRGAKKTAGGASIPASASDARPGNGKSEPTQAEIAEAAYFKHLNRGGNQGDEFRDWIEAERELRERHSR